MAQSIDMPVIVPDGGIRRPFVRSRGGTQPTAAQVNIDTAAATFARAPRFGGSQAMRPILPPKHRTGFGQNDDLATATLPLHSDSKSKRSARWGFGGNRRLFPTFLRRRNRTRAFALAAFSSVLCLYGLYWYYYSSHGVVIYSSDYPLPPLFEAYRERELALPQHNPTLPYPEGADAKFLWLPNHVHRLGWGNAMQELIFNAHLAFSTGRAFVFDNYTWDRDGGDYTRYNGKLIPSRVPLSALISGPIVGGPFPEGVHAPRAVTKEYYDTLCPRPTVIPKSEVDRIASGDATALNMMQEWRRKLLTIKEACVQVEREANPLFDYMVFGSADRLLNIWPTLLLSPIMSSFRWSPLIHAAFDKNIHLISSATNLTSLSDPLSNRPNPSSTANPYTPIPGLLALHIRRGDFGDHCRFLAKHSSRFSGFNSFPAFLDKFEPPPTPGPAGKWTKLKREEYYMPRCIPNIQEIVQKVKTICRSPAGKNLREIYLMTNASPDWITDLKSALLETRDWDTVSSSRELDLNWEQKYVLQAVDMLIGQRAEVFIGNGFSSLTGNVAMLRLAMGKMSTDSIRLW